jgi:hypothetical protein
MIVLTLTKELEEGKIKFFVNSWSDQGMCIIICYSFGLADDDGFLQGKQLLASSLEVRMACKMLRLWIEELNQAKEEKRFHGSDRVTTFPDFWYQRST